LVVKRFSVSRPQLVDSFSMAKPGAMEFLSLFVCAAEPYGCLSSVRASFPGSLGCRIESKAAFLSKPSLVFVLAALLPLIDAGDTRLKGYEHFVAQGPIYIVTIRLLFGLNIIAAWTKREWFQKVFSVFFLIYITVFISINLPVIG